MLALLAAAGVLAAPAPMPAIPAQQRICTQIGCADGVYVELPALPAAARRPGARATLCVGNRCRSVPATSSGISVEDQSLNGAGPVRVRLALRSAAGRTILRRERRVALAKSRPNGPGCDPVCWNASLRLEGGVLRRIA